MIVACASCRARFRIADEKVGPRGARVRCPKCKNVFAVGPVAAPDAATASAQAPAPFEDFSEAPPPVPPPRPRQDDPFAGATPAAGPSPERAEAVTDPFAGFLAGGAGTPEPTPPGFGLGVEGPEAPEHGPAGETPVQGNGSKATVPPGFLASLAVTNLADLEKTGAQAFVTSLPPLPDESDESSLGLSLEERTPVGIPVDHDLAAAQEGMPGPAESFDEAFPAPDSFPEVEHGVPPQAVPGGAAAESPSFDDEPPFEVRGPPPLPPPAAPTLAAPPVAPGGEPEAAPPAPRGEESGPVEADTFGGRRLHGVLMNALSLALLLFFTAGILIWWRGESVLSVVRRAAHAPASPLLAIAKTNGFYETSSGRPLVFVRGEVRSQSASPMGPVRVRAEMVQAGRVVARAEGLAGAVPTPEELAGLVSREEADRLGAALARRAPAGLAPGQELPFLLTFLEYPPDMGEVTFRVTADPAPAQ